MNNDLFIEITLMKMHKNIFLDNYIYNFIKSLENQDQQVLLYKIFREYDTHKIYLIDFINHENEIIINVLGGKQKQSNLKNIKRKVYTVFFNKINNNFTCNCKDFLYRCKNQKNDDKNVFNGYVCKHISFLVCKVGKILDTEFFNTLKLNNNNKHNFINSLENENTWKDSNLSIKHINDDFKQYKYDIEDICPICYEKLGLDNLDIIKCLKCKKNIHKECMEIWLEINNSCVYCRDSEKWRNYIKL